MKNSKIEGVIKWLKAVKGTMVQLAKGFLKGKIQMPEIILGIGDLSCSMKNKVYVSLKESEAETLDKPTLLRILKFKLYHELAHSLYTDDEQYKTGHEILKQIWNDEAEKRGLKIFDKVSENIANFIMNSLCDGRIENIIINKMIGIRKHRDWYRTKYWLESEIEEKYPFRDLLNQILFISTMGLYQKGFSNFYDDSDYETEVIRKCIPHISDYVKSNTIEEAYGSIRKIGELTKEIVVNEIAISKEEFDENERLKEVIENIVNDLKNSDINFNSGNKDGGNEADKPQNGPIIGILTDDMQKSDDDEPGVKPDIIIDLRTKKQEPENESEDEEDDEEESTSGGSSKDSDDSQDEKNEDNQEGCSSASSDSENTDGEDNDFSNDCSSGSTDETKEGENQDNNDSLDGGLENDKENLSKSNENMNEKDNKMSQKNQTDKQTSSLENNNNDSNDTDSNSGVSNSDESNGDESNGDDNGDDSSDNSGQESDLSKNSENDGENKENPQKTSSKDIENALKNALKKNEEEERNQLKRDMDNIRKEEMALNQLEEGDKYSLTREDIEDMKKFDFGKRNFDEQKTLKDGVVLQGVNKEINTRAKRTRSKIENIIKTKIEENREETYEGDLDDNALGRFCLGKTDIFKQDGNAEEPEMACIILKDDSGSMSGYNEIYAIEALSEIEDMLKGLFPLKIIAFSTNYGETIKIIKDWQDERTDKSYTQTYHKYNRPSGCNNDAYAITIANKLLMKRPEKNKLMIVISDGEPSDCETTDVRTAVKMARKNGIFVISLFIGTKQEQKESWNVFKEMYETYFAAVEPKELGNALFRFIRAFIDKMD